MDRLKIQAAVTRILTSYLASHRVESRQVSDLIVNVGQALSPHLPPPEPEIALPPARRTRRASRRSDEFETQRIEHPDQPELFDETEAVVAEALIGETAGDDSVEPDRELQPEDVSEPEDEKRSKRGPRSGRDIAEADAETVIEDGVSITRIPEVKRRRHT